MPHLTNTNHWSLLQDLLSNLWISGEFSDVTIVCDDGTHFKVHKAILSGCSDFFKNIFEVGDDKEDFVIRILDHESKTVEAVLDYLYLGQRDIELNEADNVSSLAKAWNIPQLQDGVIKMENSPEETFDNHNDSGYKEDESEWISLDANSLFGGAPIVIKEEKVDIKEEKPIKAKNDLTVNKNTQSEDTYTSTYKPRTTVEEAKWKVKCIACEKLYVTKNGMMAHYKIVHEGRRFSCTKCDKEFNTKEHFTVHYQYHHEGITIPCTGCDKRFVTKAGAIMHYREIHEGRRHECPDCGKVFHQKGAMKTHYEDKHLGKKHPCKHASCSYATGDPSNLKKHENREHGRQKTRNKFHFKI